MNNSLLKYTVTNEDYTFYYRDKEIFKSVKNSPFLCLRMEKEGVKKLLPFNEFEITKEVPNSIELSFFAPACVVKLRLSCDENTVGFSFNKIGKPDDRLYIRLIKNNSRAVGLGLNEKKGIDRIKIGVLDKIKEKKKDKNPVNIDNTLNFYVVNGYYFFNKNINDWQLEIGSAVTVSSAQEKIEFGLEYNKTFSFLPQKNYKILKTTLEEQDKESDSNYDAFIVNYRDEIRTPYVISKIRKRNKGIFITVSPLISEEEAEKNYKKEALIKTENGYLVDVTDEENLRKFANYVRRVLNLNPDGIYVDENGVNPPENVLLKNVLFYENLHALINKIKCEYPKKYVIYNKLNTSVFNGEATETEPKKTKSVFDLYKDKVDLENELYSVDYTKIVKKENVYINSLLFSGYRAYFYECSPDDIELLNKQCKYQLIVDNAKCAKNSHFRKKMAKNSQA